MSIVNKRQSWDLTRVDARVGEERGPSSPAPCITDHAGHLSSLHSAYHVYVPWSNKEDSLLLSLALGAALSCILTVGSGRLVGQACISRAELRNHVVNVPQRVRRVHTL